MIRLRETSKQNWAFFGLGLSSGREDDYRQDYIPKNILFLYAFNRCWYWDVPRFLKADKVCVDFNLPDGKHTYHKIVDRKYSIMITEDSIDLKYGLQPDAYELGTRKGYKYINIPWKQTERVRYDFYYPNGDLFESHNDKIRGRSWFESLQDIRDRVPKTYFTFKDFDGEEIQAECHLQEMEWRYGTGYAKWIRLFKKPIINRNLDIWFNKETGGKKGSWKGGTIGDGVKTFVGETPTQSFMRYANEHGFTDVQQLPDNKMFEANKPKRVLPEPEQCENNSK